MKHLTRIAAVAATILSVSTLSVSSATYAETFNYGALDANLTESHTIGFSLALVGGRCELTKVPNVGNGGSYIKTAFEVGGDFAAVVRAARTSVGPGVALGIAVSSTNGFSDVFFKGPDRIVANLFQGPGFGTRSVNQSAMTCLFRIRRTGGTVALQYDVGGGFQTLHSATDESLTGPVIVNLIHLEEQGRTTAASGWFDDLDIVADRFVPDVRSRLAVEVELAAVLVSWPSIASRSVLLRQACVRPRAGTA